MGLPSSCQNTGARPDASVHAVPGLTIRHTSGDVSQPSEVFKYSVSSGALVSPTEVHPSARMKDVVVVM